VIERGLASP